MKSPGVLSEGEGGLSEREAAAEEEEEDKEKERQRRAALAARMAKLGRPGYGMTPPVYASKKSSQRTSTCILILIQFHSINH